MSRDVIALVDEAEEAERRGDWHRAYTTWNRAAWSAVGFSVRQQLAGKARDVAERCVIAWNAAHPEGTEVRYWPAMRQDEGRISRTSSEARIVSGAAVVWVDGYGGCIALSHVEALTAAQPETTPAELVTDGQLKFRDDAAGGAP